MAQTVRKTEQDYLGFTLTAHFASESGAYTCGVIVTHPDGSRSKYVEFIDAVLRDDKSLGLPRADDEFERWLTTRAISRARAAIALDELQTLAPARFDYSPHAAPTKSDDEIQITILTAFRRIKRLDAQHFGHVPLDASGICLLREIRKDEFDYNLQRLQDRGWVEAWGMGWDDNNNNAKITEPGLQALEEIERSATQVVDTTVEAIVEESTTEYFVAHEFSPDQIDDLRAAIHSALSDSGLTPYYADNELRQGHIFNDKILERIRTSRFGIYEVSNPNKPNVFLELGAGLALGKPCIIICKKGTQVPADLQGLDRIEYQSYLDLTSQLNGKVKPYL